MRTTQRQNVLRHLLTGPLCGVHDDWELGRRVAARIHELRTVGFDIGRKECALSHGHATYQIQYNLLSSAADYIVDWCAYCGVDGTLRFTTMDPDGQRMVWQCDRCGRKDYR